MNSTDDIKTALENNFRVNKSPLLKMAIDCITDLENRIEKMRRCENCSNFKHKIDHRCNTECKNLSKWEFQSD